MEIIVTDPAKLVVGSRIRFRSIGLTTVTGIVTHVNETVAKVTFDNELTNASMVWHYSRTSKQRVEVSDMNNLSCYYDACLIVDEEEDPWHAPSPNAAFSLGYTGTPLTTAEVANNNAMIDAALQRLWR